MDWLKDLWNNGIVWYIITTLLGIAIGYLLSWFNKKALPWLDAQGLDDAFAGLLDLLQPQIDKLAADPKKNAYDLLKIIFDKLHKATDGRMAKSARKLASMNK